MKIYLFIWIAKLIPLILCILFFYMLFRCDDCGVLFHKENEVVIQQQCSDNKPPIEKVLSTQVALAECIGKGKSRVYFFDGKCIDYNIGFKQISKYLTDNTFFRSTQFVINTRHVASCITLKSGRLLVGFENSPSREIQKNRKREFKSLSNKYARLCKPYCCR